MFSVYTVNANVRKVLRIHVEIQCQKSYQDTSYHDIYMVDIKVWQGGSRIYTVKELWVHSEWNVHEVHYNGWSDIE